MSNHTTNRSPDAEPVQNGRTRGRFYRRMHANPALSLTSKIVITLVGTMVMGAGLVMMITPGPGIVGIVLGLAILATEWEWADRWLVAAKRKAQQAKEKAEAMDPAVRRRRLLLVGVAVLVIAVVVVGYVALFDWPSPAVDGWDWLQGLAGWVPELPGM